MSKRVYIILSTILSVILIVTVLVLYLLVIKPRLAIKIKQGNFNKQVAIIEKSASNIITTDEYKNMMIGETKSLTLKNLYDKKYLGNIKNPYTNKSFPDDSYVYITKNNDNSYSYHYEYRDDCRYNNLMCLKDNVKNDLKGKSGDYQGGTYYKGTNDQIKNNYVWYSGEEYRIMGINSDGSIKLVTSLPVVSISWGSVGIAEYSNSYVRKWLNVLPDGSSLKDNYEGIFYKSLSRSDLIENYDFCIGKQDPTSTTDTTCNTKINDKIGMLTWCEYKMAETNEKGIASYLNISDRIMFSTVDSRNANNVLSTDYNGSLFLAGDEKTYLSSPLDSFYTASGVRPVINLKDTVSISSGRGTSNDPYRIVGDESANKNDLLTSRYAGEYLNIGNNKYRIVSKDSNGNIKVVSDTRIISTGTSKDKVYTYFDRGSDINNLCNSQWPYSNCNNSFNPADGSGDYNGDLGYNIGYFLNSDKAANSFYNSLDSYKSYLVSNTYYLGKWSIGKDYKKIYTDVTTNGYGTLSLNVGMLQYGEMLAGNNINSSSNAYNYWLISPYDDTVDASYISTSGNATLDLPNASVIGVRPVITLKSTIKITSGKGTKYSPYSIAD